MAKDSRNAEVAELDDVLLGNEDILALDVSVEDFAIVDVLQAEADLGEPVHDLGFGEVPATLVGDEFGEVSAVGEVHDDAQVSLLRLVEFSESDDVWVIQHL